VIITHTNCRGRAFNVVWLLKKAVLFFKEMILMIKKQIKNQIPPYGCFPEPFGDEVTELVLRKETLTASNENGYVNCFNLGANLPPIFGRS
jgi:hypothetical protein